MAFTDHEKARIRHFLGYPSWSGQAASIQLGYPAGSQPLFLLEDAFNRLLPDGENTVRKDLCQCEETEAQMGTARSRMKADQLGNLRANKTEVTQLQQTLVFWSQRLADDLGVVRNPYSSMAYNGMAGGINATVQSS